MDDRTKHPCKGCEAPDIDYSVRVCPRLGYMIAIEGCNKMQSRPKKTAWSYIDKQEER